MIRKEFHAMGSRMLAAIDSSSPAATEALEAVPGWFEEWEQVFSRFRFDSELSRLNRSGGGPVVVSDTFWEVFQLACEMEKKTGGLVSATVLEALVQAGYDRSFELLEPPDVLVAGLPAAVAGMEIIGRDPATRTLYLPAGLGLDFGGSVKGWAAQTALKRLQDLGPALVNAGGDLAISTPCLDGSLWPVGVANPFVSGEYLETLRVDHGGVATSGTDYHRWFQAGSWSHHLIDPRSGLPAVTDLVTVTVLAGDPMQAEAAAKTVLISGSGPGLEWLEADSSLAGFLILQSGERLVSRRMKDHLWRENDNIQ
jgi:FAD:protein FMN transferase